MVPETYTQQPMPDDAVLRVFRSIRSWVRHDQRAPHKALLLLIALAQIQRDGGRWLSYPELEPKLRNLLSQFGPPRRTQHPEHPSWRLRNDGIWEIREKDSSKGW